MKTFKEFNKELKYYKDNFSTVIIAYKDNGEVELYDTTYDIPEECLIAKLYFRNDTNAPILFKGTTARIVNAFRTFEDTEKIDYTEDHIYLYYKNGVLAIHIVNIHDILDFVNEEVEAKLLAQKIDSQIDYLKMESGECNNQIIFSDFLMDSQKRVIEKAKNISKYKFNYELEGNRVCIYA